MTSFRGAAHSHALQDVVDSRHKEPARFSGLKIKRLKPIAGKDVETPCFEAPDFYHVLKSVAMCRMKRGKIAVNRLNIEMSTEPYEFRRNLRFEAQNLKLQN